MVFAASLLWMATYADPNIPARYFIDEFLDDSFILRLTALLASGVVALTALGFGIRSLSDGCLFAITAAYARLKNTSASRFSERYQDRLGSPRLAVHCSVALMPKFVYVVGLALPTGVVADRRSGDRITLATGLLVT